jgi:hypothetical protein
VGSHSCICPPGFDISSDGRFCIGGLLSLPHTRSYFPLPHRSSQLLMRSHSSFLLNRSRRVQ